MRSYSIFAPRFWIAGTGRQIVVQLGSDHAIVAIYLFTGPSAHMGGLYHLRLSIIAEDVGLSAGRVREILTDLERIGFAKYDRDAQVVWVIEMMRHQLTHIRERDNRLRSIIRHAANLPDTPLVAQFANHYGLDIEGAYEGAYQGGRSLPALDPAPAPVLPTDAADQKKRHGGDL